MAAANQPADQRQRDRSARKSSGGTKAPAVNNENRPAATNVAPPNHKRSAREDAKPGANEKATPSDATPPQSVAIVAGRKYIMVPKAVPVGASPSAADAVNGFKST